MGVKFFWNVCSQDVIILDKSGIGMKPEPENEKGLMNMKNWKKTIVFTILLLSVALFAEAGTVSAKTKTIKIDLTKSASVTKRPAVLSKAKKVKVKSSKPSVVKVKYKNRRIIFTGKKPGTATVTVRCYLKKGKKKAYKYKVKVTKSRKTSQTREKPAFAGTLTATLNDVGYVKLQYSKITGAEHYVIQRKTETGAWKKLKTAWKTSCTDQTVQADTVYYYRVQARVSGTYTQYSSAVKIQVGKIGTGSKDSVNPTPKPTPTPATPSVPTPSPTPTPYQAKYSYEVSVLNQFTIYEDVPIVLYVKTDNPNPNDFDNVYVNIGAYGEKVSGGPAYSYEDIQYLEQEETNTKYFKKVKGGWIYTCRAEESGIQTVSIQELEKGENNNNTWRTVDTFQIEVKDGAASRKAFCEKVIQTVSSDDYNEDGLGKWGSLTVQQKMERLEEYIRDNMNYPRIDTNGSYLGYNTIWILQENVGVDWETGFTDCGGAAKLLREMAGMIGIEAYTWTTQLNGGIHIVVRAVIAGEEYYYDATPWEGGYKNWDYIQLDKY